MFPLLILPLFYFHFCVSFSSLFLSICLIITCVHLVTYCLPVSALPLIQENHKLNLQPHGAWVQHRCSTQLVLVMTTNSTSRSGYAGDIESRKHTQRKQFSKKSSPCPFIIYRGYTRHIPSAHFQFVDNETLSTVAIQDTVHLLTFSLCIKKLSQETPRKVVQWGEVYSDMSTYNQRRDRRGSPPPTPQQRHLRQWMFVNSCQRHKKSHQQKRTLSMSS